jgi:hypothetical protein
MKIRKQLVKIKNQGFHFAVVMEHPVWSCNLGIFMSCDVNLTNFSIPFLRTIHGSKFGLVWFGLVSL